MANGQTCAAPANPAMPPAGSRETGSDCPGWGLPARAEAHHPHVSVHDAVLPAFRAAVHQAARARRCWGCKRVYLMTQLKRWLE